MSAKRVTVMVALSLFLAAWARAVGAVAPPAQAVPPLARQGRDRLTLMELMAEEYRGDGPIDNGYFLAVGDTAPAVHPFEGTLAIPRTEMGNTLPPAACERNEDLCWFPPLSLPFFTHEGYLVPTERGMLCPSEPHYWCAIFSPGTVWSEPADGGLSRASFPFILVNEWSNNTHNGVAAFLYDDSRVSSLRFQITQETDPDDQIDFWGQAAVEYVPGPVEDRTALAAQFAEELVRQVPIRPWAELEERYDPALLDRFTGHLPPEKVSAAGLVMDGVIYLQPAMTRYGEYPYPRAMRHGVYSVTKSMGAAIALLRLAQKYGEGVCDLRIADYVTVTAEHDGWEEVTFADALNMATGVGETVAAPGDANFSGDERRPHFMEFIRARSAQDKLDIVFEYPSYPWGPGEVTRYNSINTFALAAAMDSYLKEQEGPDAYLWDMVSREVFEPIGVYHLPIMHTVEQDGGRGLPLLFMGLYPTVDDVAKIAALLQDGGRHGGEQLLHATKLEEALYRRGLAGLPTGDRFPDGDWAYNLSFHSVAYRTGDGRYFQVPFMAGLGGNVVVLAPNGISGFVFTDANRMDALAMTRVLEGLRPFSGAGITSGQLLPLGQGIQTDPQGRRMRLILDRGLLLWLVLITAALGVFLYDQVRGSPMSWPRRLIWLLVVLVLGPLGLLGYWLVHRRRAGADQSEAYSPTGDPRQT